MSTASWANRNAPRAAPGHRPGRCCAWLALLGLLPVVVGCQWAAQAKNVEGVRALEAGYSQAAVQRFSEAIARNPRHPDGYYNLAATYHRQARATSQSQGQAAQGSAAQGSAAQWYGQAETLYRQCLQLSGDHVEANRGLAVLLRETRREAEGLQSLTNWATRSPGLADARIELARFYQERGDLATAQLHLQEALRVDDQNARVWRVLGRIREDAGQYEQAVANYRRSLQLNNLQPGIEQRVATLQRSVSGGFYAPDGTRTVTLPAAGNRF